jgi:hypothetical protein
MGGSSLDGFLLPIGINRLFMTLEHFGIISSSKMAVVPLKRLLLGSCITLYTIRIAKEYY